MDGTFKETESASDSNNCSAVRDEGAAAFMEESHTDDEEDVRLNLDCSKSDDEDDLGESDHHEASDNENNTEGDLIGAQNSTDEGQINTSKEKVLEDSDKNHTDDKEELQSADNQTSGIVEEEASENTDKDHAADKQQEDNGPAKSDDEPDGNKAKTTAEVEDVHMETVDSQNEDVTEKSKSEEETQHKDCEGEAKVETKGDQNSKEVDKPNEKLLKDLENHTDDKDNEDSGNQTKDESEKDTKKGTDGSHDGVEQDVSSNSVDDPDKSDHDKSKDDKTKTVPEVENDSGSKESSQNKENAEKSKNEEETPKTDGEKEAESKDQSEKNDDKGDKYSLLKETLSKPNDEAKEQENNEEEMDEDFDPSDFDPSLLCPEVAMEVDEAPVISPANDSQNDDGAKSPILFDAVFSTYVDEMTGTETCFDLTPEEDKLRQETYGQKNPVQYTKIHCTACNVHLGSALDGQGNRFVHPLLKVLICKNCYYFYSSGEFERDEDGSELYCRWCGQGGQVMCCSKCEMVFCKKCIRINFDRKKIADIRDSDDWLCFRCNPSQITHLKIHCAEFMEYVRRERSRAVTLENYSAFTNADHALCCQSMKKKATDTPPEQPKRKRRRAAPVDPDYNPLKDEEDDNDVIEKVPHTIAPTPAAKAASTPPAVAPRANGVPSRPLVQQVRPGMTSVRPRTPQQQFRPRLQPPGAVSMQAQRPGTTPSPGYIKILPGGVVVPGNTPRPMRVMPPRPQHTVIRQQAPTQSMVRPRVQGSAAQSQTKHEWFEKTVRAAARVNSNLSYTLTNLNRAQAAATSVEALAVVHNKLQEILSTSINSLIQIRKNLRAEFIQGIKNARFPTKPQAPTTSTTPTTSTSKSCDQDDDVIIISPASSPKPATKAGSLLNTSTPSTSRSVDSGRVGSGGARPFLRVKSLTALQNVTAECITIPDDPPEMEKPTEVEIDAKKKGLDTTKVIKVDITKILAGEDPALESSSSKEEKSKEADKKEPRSTKGKSQDKKANCEDKGKANIEETSSDKKKTDSKEKKIKDKSNEEKTSEKETSEEKGISDKEETNDKSNVEKTSEVKQSEKEEKTPGEENTNLDVTSDEKEVGDEEPAKNSDEKEVGDEEPAKNSSNRSSPEPEPLQGFESVVEPSDKEEPAENEVMSEEEPTKSSSKRSTPIPSTMQDCKVVLERTKDVETNEKTD